MRRARRLRPTPTAALSALAVLLSSLAMAVGVPGPARALPGTVHLNQMQVIGSHNSFHVEPPADLLATLIGFDPTAIQLAYSHPPLDEQFSYEGVRQIELDVYADPAGTLWRPIGTAGWKVMHIEGIDERSTCEVFVQCLQVVKAWSDTHLPHMPIAVLVEIHDTCDVCGPPDPLPVGPAEFDTLDAEIRSVFPPDRLLTPDDVRGAHPTLEAAILTDGWPLIDAVRGRTMFLLDNKRDDYRTGHPSLEGRVAFTPSTPGQPDAAFIKQNDPTGANTAQIQAWVAAGYVVRTRADEPHTQAAANDTSMRDAALASGAQWVSTDYPLASYSARWGTTYEASIPGGRPARCNPVNAPPECAATDIENLPIEVRPATTTTTTRPPVPVVTPSFTG